MVSGDSNVRSKALAEGEASRRCALSMDRNSDSFWYPLPNCPTGEASNKRR